MAHASLIARFSLALVPALVFSALGCAAHVVTEGGSEGEGGGEAAGTSQNVADTGQGAGAECKAFTGVGCKPGETRPCSGWDGSSSGSGSGSGTYTGNDTCFIVSGCETSWSDGCWTPLVLSFDGAEVDYRADAAHSFDINGASSQITDWPTARTPWLALDRDGSGAIEDGSELFGSMSPLRDGGRAQNGFVALRELDANGDGRITAEDPGFARLSVWSDRDGDRRSGPGELASAAAWDIVAIDLDDVASPVCDARGNCGVERAAFTFRDAAGLLRTGTVIDVHLRAQR